MIVIFIRVYGRVRIFIQRNSINQIGKLYLAN